MRQWHKPVELSPLETWRVPNSAGVYVLLEDSNRLGSVLKIAPARSLRETFERELSPDLSAPAQPRAMMFFEAVDNAQEADRLLRAYRDRNGKRPVLNSPY